MLIIKLLQLLNSLLYYMTHKKTIVIFNLI
nr:MAG TPA: hypothetical protein [Caudoviricetes sp.]